MSKLKLEILMLSAMLVFAVPPSRAGEWLTLVPQDLKQIEVAQEGALSYASEGVYFTHVDAFPTTTCKKNRYVVITDPTLAERALGAGMFAISAGKTLRFYVVGCEEDYLHAKIFLILP